ncbi:ferredoxin-type protein NapF [Sulfurimonas sp. MAG313]|nr:ferredoxin-type protein NapF [Sulfurimonas sp. MAG313]MDF1881287.1 ferredoxin-type protein NapF [Sulfurimonas sp. MAG313]
MDRRELFSSFTSGGRANAASEEETIIRPPYNIDESLFHKSCHDCDGICATVCEVDIISIGADKTPFLSFDKSGCTFCDECAKACDYGVLSLENEAKIHNPISISVSACMAWDSVMCMSCKDPCLDRAIIFQGLFKPVIDASKCTGCGFCISRCPTFAIEVEKSA